MKRKVTKQSMLEGYYRVVLGDVNTHNKDDGDFDNCGFCDGMHDELVRRDLAVMSTDGAAIIVEAGDAETAMDTAKALIQNVYSDPSSRYRNPEWQDIYTDPFFVSVSPFRLTVVSMDTIDAIAKVG